jgi:hypothetical protein
VLFLPKRHRVNPQHSNRASFRPHLEGLEQRCLFFPTEVIHAFEQVNPS